MSNATEKTAIGNIGFLSVGNEQLNDLTDTTDPKANKMRPIFESVVKELLSDDWHFSRRRTLLSNLTAVNKLTLDTAPSPAVFKVGATLTGATSEVTCTVLERMSDTVYLVTEPSGDFTDGEVIGDGTNTIDCDTNYPDIDETLAHGSYDYGYLIPTDLLFIRGIKDKDYDKTWYPYTKEGKILLANRTNDYLHYNKWIGEDESTTVSDVTLMPHWFHRLISARLAYILSPNVTQNQRREAKAEIEYEMAYNTAKEQNGMEIYREHDQGNLDWANGSNNELAGL